jgi:enoyl-CoA hydratase/carnithine racemase
MLKVIYRCPKPTIARVQGDVYAGGTGLVAACDIAVSVDTAQYCLSEVKLGLIPATISPYVVRAMGARAAHRYFLTAERFGAAEALRIGLVHEVVPAASSMRKVAESRNRAAGRAGGVESLQRRWCRRRGGHHAAADRPHGAGHRRHPRSDEGASISRSWAKAASGLAGARLNPWKLRHSTRPSCWRWAALGWASCVRLCGEVFSWARPAISADRPAAGIAGAATPGVLAVAASCASSNSSPTRSRWWIRCGTWSTP